MKDFMQSIIGFVILTIWLLGIVVVKGFWWTVLSIMTPLGLYFGFEHIFKLLGIA